MQSRACTVNTAKVWNLMYHDDVLGEQVESGMLCRQKWDIFFWKKSYLIRLTFGSLGSSFVPRLPPRAKLQGVGPGQAWGGIGQFHWRGTIQEKCGPIFNIHLRGYIRWWPQQVTRELKTSQYFLLRKSPRDAISSQPSPLPPSPTRFAQPSSSLCIRLDSIQPARSSFCRLCLLHQFAPGYHLRK